MDWFLNDNGLRHEKVNLSVYIFWMIWALLILTDHDVNWRQLTMFDMKAIWYDVHIVSVRVTATPFQKVEPSSFFGSHPRKIIKKIQNYQDPFLPATSPKNFKLVDPLENGETFTYLLKIFEHRIKKTKLNEKVSVTKPWLGCFV